MKKPHPLYVRAIGPPLTVWRASLGLRLAVGIPVLACFTFVVDRGPRWAWWIVLLLLVAVMLCDVNQLIYYRAFRRDLCLLEDEAEGALVEASGDLFDRGVLIVDDDQLAFTGHATSFAIPLKGMRAGRTLMDRQKLLIDFTIDGKNRRICFTELQSRRYRNKLQEITKHIEESVNAEFRRRDGHRPLRSQSDRNDES